MTTAKKERKRERKKKNLYFSHGPTNIFRSTRGKKGSRKGAEGYCKDQMR
jgi:hypothetical protein